MHILNTQKEKKQWGDIPLVEDEESRMSHTDTDGNIGSECVFLRTHGFP